jgi:hypothetical protein
MPDSEIEFEALRVMVREAMTAARVCWREWRDWALSAGPPGKPLGPSAQEALTYADLHPWLKETDDAKD